MLNLPIILGGLLALSLIGGFANGKWQHHAGYVEGKTEIQAKLDAANAEADRRLAEAETANKAIREQAESEIKLLRASRPTSRAQVKALTDANPTFAATVRPAGLSALRLRQLHAIAAATGNRPVR